MVVCDLCGSAKACQPKEIEQRLYDICADCWSPMAEKLKGKGRRNKEREMVTLPSPITLESAPEAPKRVPGAPPKIWGVGTSHRKITRPY